MLEDQEAAHIQGQDVDFDAYVSLVQVAVRLSNTIGLNRKQKNVPSLDEYLGSKVKGNARATRARIDPDDDDEDDD